MAGSAQKILKVFISSTKVDLEAERKAAFDAVLKAGHMPVGMENFTSGGDPPWDVIKAWIDDCDVYILIIGGKYGTLYLKTKKSFTQMEYEYANAQGKEPCYCIIKPEALNAKVKLHGVDAAETKHGEKFNKFLAAVKNSYICEFWSDEKEIQHIIASKLGKINLASEPNITVNLPQSPLFSGPTIITSNIPPGLAHYIERTELLNQIRASLASNKGVSLQAQLTAHGGFGKSVLAAAYAQAALASNEYPGGAYFVNCENRAIAEAFSELLLSTDETLKMSTTEKVQFVRSHLASKKSLVIFGNVDSHEQWLEFKTSGLYPTCDILITTRAKNIAGLEPIRVDHLTLDETRSLLAKFSDSALLPENDEAMKTILEETEGLAVLVAAVGGSQRDAADPNDWNRYANWLKTADTGALPDEKESGYPNRTNVILDDLIAKLKPAQLRILEYAAILPPNRIRLSWLEWLLGIDATSETEPLDVGNDKLGAIYPVNWHLNQLKQWDILRPLGESDEIWSVHRLYRKRVTETSLSDIKKRNEHVSNLRLLSETIWKSADEIYEKFSLSDTFEVINQAVEILESLAEGAKSNLGLQLFLAYAYRNRGSSYGRAINQGAAIADFTKSILIHENYIQIVNLSPEAGNQLASVYIDRGIAYRICLDLDSAIADHTRAIEIRESLRLALFEKGDWHHQFQSNLAYAYMNRAIVYAIRLDFSQAIADFSSAIGIADELRATLSALGSWHLGIRSEYVKILRNRALAYEQSGQINLATADFHAAVEVEAIEGP